MRPEGHLPTVFLGLEHSEQVIQASCSLSCTMVQPATAPQSNLLQGLTPAGLGATVVSLFPAQTSPVSVNASCSSVSCHTPQSRVQLLPPQPPPDCWGFSGMAGQENSSVGGQIRKLASLLRCDNGHPVLRIMTAVDPARP